MQKKLKEDNWCLYFKGVSIWPYLRAEYNNMKTLTYEKNLSFGLSDLYGLFQFITLPFRKNINCVFFFPARKEMISLIKDEYFPKNRMIFLRYDGHGVKGNVFFIELMRFFLRKTAYLFYFKEYRNLLSEVEELNFFNSDIRHLVRSSIGDITFNKMIVSFLRGKKIYFSNCVIPKSERTQNLHHSTEVQHGVIHDLHYCYSDVPQEFFKITLLSWGDYWFDVIKKVNSNIIVERGPVPEVSMSSVFYDGIIVFTTISDTYNLVISNFIKSISDIKFKVQKHPRDNVNYNFHFSKDFEGFTSGISPLACKFPVVHDSTLIFFLKDKNKFFYYLKDLDENDSTVMDKLYEKYKVKAGTDYIIIDSNSEFFHG
ncbi:hypothetical protein [Vibrio sp. 10N.222.55.C12]|uniref:hypothetical protein n=1 Tax=Vibrio sp. 10N.222.55.C12 TaxID=1884470 RepID=UPI000C85382D|nr:hypothetical protein [Vibrio sp. 10N.222.55.C12]PMN96596.1 hypothetical protein BCT20_02200 [Vibrio sp. 10N.222.55.C12]